MRLFAVLLFLAFYPSCWCAESAGTDAIVLKEGRRLLVRKILPRDCRLVRGFTHAPVDGREDTRHATGGVSEWSGVYGTPAVNYRIFNGKSMNRVINIIGIAGSLLVPSQGAELPRAVDRDGNPPVPIITAHDHCAWPNLKLLKDGRTLAAFIFNNASHAKRPGDIECWLGRDGGGSWKFASAVTQHEPETTRHLHASGLAANGDIIVLASGWSNRWPPGKPRTRGSFRYELLGPWLSRSPDGGHSWWVEKNTFPQETPAGRPAVPFGNIERAANGDLCVSVYSPQEPWEKFEERKFRSWLLRSSDDGKSARGLFWSNEKMSPMSRPTTNYAASSAP